MACYIEWSWFRSLQISRPLWSPRHWFSFPQWGWSIMHTPSTWEAIRVHPSSMQSFNTTIMRHPYIHFTQVMISLADSTVKFKAMRVFFSNMEVWVMNLGQEENRGARDKFHGGPLGSWPWLSGKVEPYFISVWVGFDLLTCPWDLGTLTDRALNQLHAIFGTAYHRPSKRKQKLLELPSIVWGKVSVFIISYACHYSWRDLSLFVYGHSVVSALVEVTSSFYLCGSAISVSGQFCWWYGCPLKVGVIEFISLRTWGCVVCFNGSIRWWTVSTLDSSSIWVYACPSCFKVCGFWVLVCT